MHRPQRPAGSTHIPRHDEDLREPLVRLKGETVPDSLPATPKSPPKRRGPPRGTPRVLAPLHLSPFSPPDRDRRGDSPAWPLRWGCALPSPNAPGRAQNHIHTTLRWGLGTCPRCTGEGHSPAASRVVVCKPASTEHRPPPGRVYSTESVLPLSGVVLLLEQREGAAAPGASVSPGSAGWQAGSVCSRWLHIV